MTTALRTGAHEVRDGVRLLRPDPDIPYRDGAEDRLWEIVRDASDLRSDSTEMLAVAQGWAEQYHTHPARANVVRAIDIPADATILEIGSGCGPITRYLGETGAQVDAVEPVLPRARVGRERTRDLPNVEVFCGNLEDVPTDPAYDIVIVVGVLEYVANGSRDRETYLQFLRECRTRLRPGGSLVLAIENKLGVKYLTGTGEDHSGRIFDSIEDYPRGTPARTFGSGALMSLVADAGFSPRLFGVFPDYKHTRVVFDTDRLQYRAPDLAENLPVFPSRYAGTRSVKLASESRVWRELVRDGLAAHFANSLLVIGRTEEGMSLWPDDQLAKYFSVNRRSEYRTSTRVMHVGDDITFERTYSDDCGPLIDTGMRRWEYVDGRSFLDAFLDSDNAERRDLLLKWIDLLTEATDNEVVPVDAIPTNVIVGRDGSLCLIDNEFHEVTTVDRAVIRGMFWLAYHITRDSPPELWSPATTVGEVLNNCAELAGVSIDTQVIDQFIADEASFQVAVTSNYAGSNGLDEATAAVHRLLDAKLTDATLGRRLHDDYDAAVAELEHLRTHYAAAIAQRDQFRSAFEHRTEQRNRLRTANKKAAATQDRLRIRLSAKQRELKESRKEARANRTAALKAERALATVQRSRAHKTAEVIRRKAVKFRSLIGR